VSTDPLISNVLPWKLAGDSAPIELGVMDICGVSPKYSEVCSEPSVTDEPTEDVDDDRDIICPTSMLLLDDFLLKLLCVALNLAAQVSCHKICRCF